MSKLLFFIALSVQDSSLESFSLETKISNNLNQGFYNER
jgi:hypothetical protein